MFRVESDLHGIRDGLQCLQLMLAPRGVCVTVLRFDGSGTLIYVFRPNRLEEALARPGVSEFLARYGYEPAGAAGMVAQLKRRYAECPSSPPEVGVFLDYPVEDVVGYIENSGKCCRCIGCWKVYGDVGAAEKRFASFKKCRDIYCRLFSEGRCLADLAVRARSEPAVQRALLPPLGLRLPGRLYLV